MKHNNLKRFWEVIIATRIINIQSGGSNQLQGSAAYRMSWDFSFTRYVVDWTGLRADMQTVKKEVLFILRDIFLFFWSCNLQLGHCTLKLCSIIKSPCITAETNNVFYVSLSVHPRIVSQINPNRCTLLLNIFIYFSSLHVSGVHVPIIRRKFLYLCDTGI